MAAGGHDGARAAPLELAAGPLLAHRPNGRWQPPAIDGIALFNMATVPVTRYRHRGSKIPNPWVPSVNA